ncbi:MAG: hypothetical protein H6735_25910 [Alphaproteobacteria bacterium]|nr:hypothetical protein [Alphaproteobacteria bacterium]
MATDLRVAVVGATGALGGEIVKVLDAVRWRPSGILPLARPTTSTTHVEYGGESLPVDDLDADALEDADAVLVAVPPSAAGPAVEAAVRLGLPVVDASGASASDPQIPLVVPWVNPEALQEVPQLAVAIPDAAATLLASVLGPLRRAGVDGELTATVFVPASTEGRAGIEELSRQVVALFNSQTPPRKVFREGLAFDLLPALGTVGESGWTDRERAVSEQVARLVGGGACDATLVGVPVFSGISAEIVVRTARPVPLELAQRILGDGGARLPEAAGPRYLPRPRRVEGHPFAHVGRIRHGAEGRSLHVWASMDNLRTTATAVVAAAGTLLRAGAHGEA